MNMSYYEPSAVTFNPLAKKTEPVLSIVDPQGRAVLQIVRDQPHLRNRLKAKRSKLTLDDLVKTTVLLLVGEALADGELQPLELRQIVKIVRKLYYPQDSVISSGIDKALQIHECEQAETVASRARNLAPILSERQKTLILEGLREVADADGERHPGEKDYFVKSGRWLGLPQEAGERIWGH